MYSSSTTVFHRIEGQQTRYFIWGRHRDKTQKSESTAVVGSGYRCDGIFGYFIVIANTITSYYACIYAVCIVY